MNIYDGWRLDYVEWDDGRLASNLEGYFSHYLGLRAEFGAPEGFTAPETRANHLNFPIFANRHFTHNGIYRLSDAFMKPAT